MTPAQKLILENQALIMEALEPDVGGHLSERFNEAIEKTTEFIDDREKEKG